MPLVSGEINELALSIYKLVTFLSKILNSAVEISVRILLHESPHKSRPETLGGLQSPARITQLMMKTV